MSQNHPLFPIKLPTQWQPASCYSLKDSLLSWLLEPSSLTAKLKRHCQEFRVEVLGQKVQCCHQDEANEMIKAGEQVLVREVLLYCDGIPQVFARSLLPLASLTGEEQQLAHLGTEPLGQVLFNNPTLERKGIEIASFNDQSSVAKLATSLFLNTNQKMWGRRSLFFVHDKPLMVAEVFLPNAFAYQDLN
jgi:chorismate--pyruvate lyase